MTTTAAMRFLLNASHHFCSYPWFQTQQSALKNDLKNIDVDFKTDTVLGYKLSSRQLYVEQTQRELWNIDLIIRRGSQGPVLLYVRAAYRKTQVTESHNIKI